MNFRAVRVPTARDVLTAAETVRHHLAPTPVLASPALGPGVVLKLETEQPTGSFKVRGAIVAVAVAAAQAPDVPLITASAGNHGLGVAFAASRLGMVATIVVPVTASPCKRDALERLTEPGRIEVVAHGQTFDEAEAYALEQADNGARFISPYNDPDVIAGQGTAALELFDQVVGLTTIVAPVGGGGLLAGLALAVSSRSDVSVQGVEADASRAVSASVAAGRVVPAPIGPTIADGLAGNLEPGSVTVEIISRLRAPLAGVAETALREAVTFLSLHHGLVVEPSGAAAVASLLSGQVAAGPGPTALMITGRNLDPALAGELLVRG